MSEQQHPYTDYQKQQNRKFTYVVAIASILFSGLLLTLLFITANKEEIKKIHVEMVWEPMWGMDMMSDEARLELGFM